MAVRLGLETPIKYIKGIGEAKSNAFARLGVETVYDLLSFYPRGYEERGKTVSISDAFDGELCSVIVTVREPARLSVPTWTSRKPNYAPSCRARAFR